MVINEKNNLMIEGETRESLLSKTFHTYPVLGIIDQANHGVLTEYLMFKSMEIDEPMTTCKSECEDMIFLLKGEIKIIRLSETGEETNLYDIRVGEVCHEYFNCIMQQQPLHILGIVQRKVIAAVVPLWIVKSYMIRNVDFISFMYHDLHAKLDYVIQSKESKLHQSLEDRIIHFLLLKKAKRVYVTHQEIALEVDAAREAVSRKLKELESCGYIKLGRGVIEIIKDLNEIKE